MSAVCPVPTMTALIPRSFSAWVSRVAVVRLPTDAVGAEHGDARAGHVEDPAGEQLQVLLVFRSAHIGDGDAGEERGRGELGVVVEELVQAVDEVHPASDAVEQHRCAALREQPVGRRHPEDQRVRREAGVRDGLGRGWPAPGCRSATPSRTTPASSPAQRAVDDAQDLVLLGMADQTVGGLAVLRPNSPSQ